jgi:hypothetical protein
MPKLKGAGAILHSNLVNRGWKFPNVKLNEYDEQYLLEKEVN